LYKTANYSGALNRMVSAGGCFIHCFGVWPMNCFSALGLWRYHADSIILVHLQPGRDVSVFCTIHAGMSGTIIVAQPTATPTRTANRTATATQTATATSALAFMPIVPNPPTPTSTPSPTATPTNTPLPTATLIPPPRLVLSIPQRFQSVPSWPRRTARPGRHSNRNQRSKCTRSWGRLRRRLRQCSQSVANGTHNNGR
jgi:hypothetical protein